MTISSESTTRVSGHSKLPPIEIVSEQRDPPQTSYGAIQLELLLADEKAHRRIERFFWVLIITALFDCFLFKFLDAWFPQTFIILLTTIFLIGLANWLEVPFVTIHLERMLARYLMINQRRDQTEPREEG